MRDHRSLWFKVSGAACMIVAAVAIVPDLAAERFAGTSDTEVDSPVDEEGLEEVETRLKQPGVTAMASREIDRARASADARTLAEADDTLLEKARQAFLQNRHLRAEQLLEALIVQRSEESSDRPDVDRARLLLAHLYTELDRHAEAAETLGAISEQTPVDDFVFWMRGRALMELDKPAEAAVAFERAFEQDTTSVKPRARVGQAHALAEAEQWSEALDLLDEVIDDFPEYPRRHRLLYQRARSLEALGEADRAARAYQQTWFEFPNKPEGQKARREMRRLAAEGHAPDPIPRDELFDRYRKLRINKHWPLAEELFLELLEEHETPDGTSEFEHEILMQLALNDYVPQNYGEALVWLERLREHYESGHTDGIQRRTLYKYLSFTYSQLGQLDRAKTALEKRIAGYGSHAKKRHRAEFYEEHGQYKRALEIYDEFYSDWRKRGWHYTWLLYKTGEFEQAYDNLTRLAERSSGKRRAKYMYWAARALERGGNLEEALDLYEDVAQAYELSYYGLQANNRIVDVEQRRAVDGTMLAHAQGLVDRGDEVLSTLDEVADTAGDGNWRARLPYRDPRLVPKTGEDTGGADAAFDLSRTDCDARTATARRLCQLSAPRMAEEHRHVLSSALAPIRPYSNLLSSGLPVLNEEDQTPLAALDDPVAGDVVEAGERTGEESPSPARRAEVAGLGPQVPRAQYHTEARIYWEGRSESPIAFARAEQGEVIGPFPDRPHAYDEVDYLGGLDRAVDRVGHLFPQLERAHWLLQAGHFKYARWEMRDAALEYNELAKKGRPRSSPHKLKVRRWDYLIDNRRKKTGFWGKDSDEKRFPVPSSSAERKELLERQKEIYERRNELERLMFDAMKDVGDYHLVRRSALGSGPWYRKDPTGPARGQWMKAYPRAFPRLVLEQSAKNGVNPYLLWALMTVESSYNPDSISPADAIGLLQVIPRTGIKTAQMLGDEDFGPFDLVDEDVAIEHGAFYFRNLVEKFRGQELLAIAGYNGGPHRVAGWLKKRGQHMPMDEFVEEIPFNEARGYTKKVLRFLALYLRIYEDVDSLYVGQNMRLDYLPDPNF